MIICLLTIPKPQLDAQRGIKPISLACKAWGQGAQVPCGAWGGAPQTPSTKIFIAGDLRGRCPNQKQGYRPDVSIKMGIGGRDDHPSAPLTSRTEATFARRCFCCGGAIVAVVDEQALAQRNGATQAAQQVGLGLLDGIG